MGSNSLRQRLTGNFALVLGIAAILLAFGGRGVPEGEARQLFEPALSLVRDGTPKIVPVGGDPTRTRRVWGQASLVESVVHLPGALLVAVGGGVKPGAIKGLTAMGARLASACLAGVIVLQFFYLAIGLGYSRTVAATSSSLLLFTTSMAVFGRTPLNHVLHTVLFTGAFSTAVEHARTPSLNAIRNLGLWLAALFSVAVGFVLMVPGVAIVAMWYGLRVGLSAPRLAWTLSWPLLVGLLVTGLDSWLRLGAWTTVFSMLWSGTTNQGALAGLWGIFFSPGQSILLYNLPIVLGCFGVRTMLVRGQGKVLWIGVAFVVPVLVYLSKYPFWGGGWGWGPQYLLYAVPVLLLPALAFAEALAERVRQRQWRALLVPGSVAIIFVGAGLVVQILGSALAPENYLRISASVREQWLGQPNRRGALLQTSSGSCTPCFEDDYVTYYLPPFQPIEGHAWLGTHLWAGDSHTTAQLTGPWHRETILDFDIKAPFEAARFDWWFLDHLATPRSIVMALLLFAALLFLAAFSVRVGFRHVKSVSRVPAS